MEILCILKNLRTIKSIGYLDELESKFLDPIAHFTKVVKEMEFQRLLEKEKTKVEFPSDEKLIINTNNRKNFGYAAFSSVYHTLEIDKFLINRQRSTKIEANTGYIKNLKFVKDIGEIADANALILDEKKIKDQEML